jgi:hypothetical protein
LTEAVIWASFDGNGGREKTRPERIDLDAAMEAIGECG